MASGCVVIALCVLATAPAELPGADRRGAEAGARDVPQVTRHIQPLLAKAGCSNRACHGSFQGQALMPLGGTRNHENHW